MSFKLEAGLRSSFVSKYESYSSKEFYRKETWRLKSRFPLPQLHPSLWPLCSLSLFSILSPWDFSKIFSSNYAKGNKGKHGSPDSGLRWEAGHHAPECVVMRSVGSKLSYLQGNGKMGSELWATGSWHPTHPRGWLLQFWPVLPCTYRVLKTMLCFYIFSACGMQVGRKNSNHASPWEFFPSLGQNHAFDVLLFGSECVVSQFLFYGAALFLHCYFSTKKYL